MFMYPRKYHKPIDGFPAIYIVLNFFRLFEYLKDKKRKKIQSCARENKKSTFSRGLNLTPELILF